MDTVRATVLPGLHSQGLQVRLRARTYPVQEERCRQVILRHLHPTFPAPLLCLVAHHRVLDTLRHPPVTVLQARVTLQLHQTTVQRHLHIHQLLQVTAQQVLLIHQRRHRILRRHQVTVQQVQAIPRRLQVTVRRHHLIPQPVRVILQQAQAIHQLLQVTALLLRRIPQRHLPTVQLVQATVRLVQVTAQQVQVTLPLPQVTLPQVQITVHHLPLTARQVQVTLRHHQVILRQVQITVQAVQVILLAVRNTVHSLHLIHQQALRIRLPAPNTVLHLQAIPQPAPRILQVHLSTHRHHQLTAPLHLLIARALLATGALISIAQVHHSIVLLLPLTAHLVHSILPPVHPIPPPARSIPQPRPHTRPLARNIIQCHQFMLQLHQSIPQQVQHIVLLMTTVTWIKPLDWGEEIHRQLAKAQNCKIMCLNILYSVAVT